jgi:hypothetical protein
MPRKLFTHTCDYCSASFQRGKKRVEGSNIFCSAEHAQLGQKRNYGAPYSVSNKYPSDKRCIVCDNVFLANTSQSIYCTDACRFTARNRRTKEKWKNRQVIGITFERGNKYEAKISLLEKTEKCPICKDSFKELNIKSIHLDHDHATGKIRGLLCFKCNAGLGQFKDSIESLKAAIAYLENAKENIA